MASRPATQQSRGLLATVAPIVPPPLAAPPIPLTTFVGREREIAAARGRLRRDDVRLLTLTGPGGIGKTRLALAVAAALAPPAVEGVAWAPLAAIRDPALVLTAVGAAFGVGELPATSPIAAIHAAVGNRRVVLLLDNCEHLLPALGDLAGLLAACPWLKVLATSREPLRLSGEWIQPVSPLSLPVPNPRGAAGAADLQRAEAVRLFANRAAAVAPAFALDETTAPVVARICRQLEGLPLAIELAAARIYQLPLAALSDRLEPRLPLLAGGPRDVPDRHRTMRGAIAWSYDLLSGREQRLYRALGVFTGGFTLAAADAVHGGPALDALSSLVDKSLLRQDPTGDGEPRFAMLEVVREFALEQLAGGGEAATIRGRHAAYFLELAGQAHPWLTLRQTPAAAAPSEAPVWMSRMVADYANLRGALEWLMASGQPLAALRLANCLTPVWDTLSHLAEASSWLERALDQARRAEVPPALAAEATANLGLFVLRRGDYDRAEALLLEARGVWGEIGGEAHLARVLMLLGGVAEYREDDERAQSYYEQALAGFREQANAAGTSDSLNNLADIAYRRADLAEADRLAAAALLVGRAAALPIQESAALITRGAVAGARGEWQAAVTMHREALRLSQAAGHLLNQGDAIAGLAEVAAMTGDGERAARLLGAIEVMIERLGVSRLSHQALHRRAIAATRDHLEAAAFAAAVATGRSLSPEEAVAAAEAAATGTAASPATARFSRREADVLRLLAAGYSAPAIAEQLYIGTRTVETHVSNIFKKLGVRNRTAAVAGARALGLIEVAPPAAPGEAPVVAPAPPEPGP